MAKIIWTFKRNPLGTNTDITSKVLSASMRIGRQEYLDVYNRGGLTFTINNNDDYASNLQYGDTIRVSDGSNGFRLDFKIQQITFSDYPGGTGLNTATITAGDFMGSVGRATVNALSLTQATVGSQAETMATNLGLSGFSQSSSSIGYAQTYTGTFTNFINLAITTERGYLVPQLNGLYFIGRNTASNYAPASITLGRTTSTTQLAYDEFSRIRIGQQFINVATISATGIADQTRTNSSSVTTYGQASYSSQTLDYNTTQASSNGDWIINNFSDPTSLRFETSLLDVAQNEVALNAWMFNFWIGQNRTMTLNYTVPAGSPTTTKVVVEGTDIEISADYTRFRLYLSPLTYYQFFTLNSSTYGILNTSRLGW